MINGGRFWLFIGAFVAVIIIVFGWFAVASPLFQRADQADAERADVESTNAQHEIVLAKMLKAEDDKEDNLRALRELSSSVPTTPELENYFDWLSEAANAAGVSLATATAGSATLFEPAKDPGPADFSAALQKSLYLIKVSIKIEGGPEQVTAFLDLLQTDGRLQLLTSVNVTFGTILGSEINGFIFVVHDPGLGKLTSAPVSSPDEPADPEQGEADGSSDAPEVGVSAEVETPGT